MSRIWPGGSYTVEVRQQDSIAVLVKRGRLSITVCNPCGPQAPPAAEAPVANGSWGVFGAGPWLSWGSAGGSHVVRLYDLWGMHDHPSPFGQVTWLDGGGGQVVGLDSLWAISWQPRILDLVDAKAWSFAITSKSRTPFVFGFALDPDLDPNPSDDQGGYDPNRGLVYTRDAGGAIGFLMRDAEGNALTSVQQYGVGRFAPAVSEEVWAAQRADGVNLLAGSRDVQFVVSGEPRSGFARYTLVVLRGTSLAELQTRADAVIALLGIP
jgi:hypothetical protein